MPHPIEARHRNYPEQDYLVPDDDSEFALTSSAKQFKAGGLQGFIQELREAHRYVNNRRAIGHN